MNELIILFKTIFPYLVVGSVYTMFGYLIQRSTLQFLSAIVIGAGTYWLFTMVPFLVFPEILYFGISMLVGIIVGYLAAHFSPEYSLW